MNNPVKTAIASFGMSGMVFHAPLLHSNPLFEIKSILERNKNLGHEKYPYSKLVRSFDELIADNDIELVIINTPDNLHYSQAKQAIEAGKHVVVEKPFTQKYEEALELIELAKKHNVVLSVFQNRRWDSDFLTVQSVLASGRLGRLVSFESHFDRYRNFIQENTWKEDPGSGAGMVYNLGSHLIDQVIVLFGRPASVSATIRSLRMNAKTDDFFNIQLEYGDNINVAVTGSLLVKETGPRYILHGTEGSFLKWGIDTQEQDLKDGRLPGTTDWGRESEEFKGILNSIHDGKEFRGKIDTIPGNYSLYYNELYEAIRHGAEVPVKPEDSALVIRVINAAFESCSNGVRVRV